MPYAEIFEQFPPELRLPVARLVDALKEELGVRSTDFDELRAIVRELAEAQQRTESRLERVETAVQELAEAQQRTESRLERLETAVQALAEAQQRTESRLERVETAVQALAEAQQRTELHMAELAQAQQRTELRVEELAQAQQRTELRVEELAQAQQRTELHMAELAQAQQRTELQVEELAQAQQRTELHMAELAQAQQRTELRVEEFARAQTLFRYTFDSQVGGLGARWGMQTEEAFRQGMRAILQEVGCTTERFLEYDAAGDVFGHPEQVELDVVIKDGKVIVVEIKSSLDRGNTYLFDRKVAFYSQRTSRRADRKLIITPFADTRAKEVALQLGVEICTDITALS
jgi:hypothetical protein